MTGVTYTTPQLVHLAILKDAADIANQRYAEEFDVANIGWRRGRFDPKMRKALVSGILFRPDEVQSQKGGLCLSIDEGVAQSLDPEERERVREIGKKAIKQALVKNQSAFVGLILGEARQGRNYFDRFDSPDQLRMF